MTYTQEHLETHAGRELSEDEVTLIDYITPIKARVGGDIINALTCRAYIEVEKELLLMPIPQEEIDKKHGVDEDGLPNVVGLSLGDFTMSVADLGETAIIELSSNEKLNRRSRHLWTTASNVMAWVPYLAVFNITEADFLTADECQERIPVEEI